MKYNENTRATLLEKIKAAMSEKRFNHVLGVEAAALSLAERYGESKEKASIAALTHDYAKERSDSEFKQVIRDYDYDLDLLNWNNAIWHGLVGAQFVEKELGITDESILQAIRLHTTGASQMSLLDKIIYVADYIEAGRDIPGVEKARAIAKKDLDEAVAYETKHTLAHLIDINAPIYPKTIETYNRWVAKKN
ncbi:bis(5'-nucleosyl)-tetraphosphatase (symmetrical) YqeK [Tetragenococcus halophilus]|uniref:bis(5'-nucleosyl)-tetraphosphatase (symmetrical) n=2 Tax=Tetragenococcus halophilus TaxID=51669 RepID=A0A2H6C1R3_TETHA|nr:bis(5'-nucleosyl)-tetraphosphatase (symmetrical) YqeK [Tetragenococcus halophilus]MCO7027118.1 bis(5'-nucleosyl)-tetraphosphatase (symmetrical) YqeK [Tetragenococcus halophilus]NRR75244.1 HD domain-containing protein [Tetragenococcus halophilus]NWN99306.1 HD domain-containing protein [Tetragenococcus halophilus]QXN85974.1 bis(5'-nucleosyl)-tetraphosphatase (symmetrical) YqeK [Tetragenococcus halophilus]RQD32653.1 HD domain-containing protein [Tetragenococcus halophilus subsp. halophilus DSM